MIRYVAFLRGINVGGHKIIKMADLRRMFESCGFTQVETYIQSGNVIFDSPEPDSRLLEHVIEQHLQEVLGYSVSIFVRTIAELAAIVEHCPFTSQVEHEHGQVYITFLQSPPSSQVQRLVLSLTNEIDEYHIHHREIFTFCRKDQGASLFSNTLLEKTLGATATTRNRTTADKIVKKYRQNNA
jgi:uncharacterized protein (DUF1697 family)